MAISIKKINLSKFKKSYKSKTRKYLNKSIGKNNTIKLRGGGNKPLNGSGSQKLYSKLGTNLQFQVTNPYYIPKNTHSNSNSNPNPYKIVNPYTVNGFPYQHWIRQQPNYKKEKPTTYFDPIIFTKEQLEKNPILRKVVNETGRMINTRFNDPKFVKGVLARRNGNSPNSIIVEQNPKQRINFIKKFLTQEQKEKTEATNYKKNVHEELLDRIKERMQERIEAGNTENNPSNFKPSNLGTSNFKINPKTIFGTR